MKVFRTLDDVERAGLPDGLFRAIRDWLRELIECHESAGYRFDADADGHAVLVEEGDGEDAVRAAIGHSLSDAPWEGVTLSGGLFLAVLMRNNQFGITVFVEDAPWLDPAARSRLEANL